ECLTPERSAAGTYSNREKRVNGLTSVFFSVPRGFFKKSSTTAKPADPPEPSHSPIRAFQDPLRPEIWHDDRKEWQLAKGERKCRMSMCLFAVLCRQLIIRHSAFDIHHSRRHTVARAKGSQATSACEMSVTAEASASLRRGRIGSGLHLRLLAQSPRTSLMGFGDFIGELGVAFIELDNAQPGFFGDVLLAGKKLLTRFSQRLVNDLLAIDRPLADSLQTGELSLGEVPKSPVLFAVFQQ